MGVEPHGFGFTPSSGLDGSRTRVQRPIPGPSTSVVYVLTFPPCISHKQDLHFSSFIIRPLPQSFGNVVSYKVETGFLICRCTKSGYSLIRLRMLNYLQRLILIWPFNPLPWDSLLPLHDPCRNHD